MIRRAQVAGQFYPGEAQALKQALLKLVPVTQKQDQALGIVAPHAGYIYSGKVAAECFAQVKLTDSVILIGPNHTGLGAQFSIACEGAWEMPLGNVAIDSPLAKSILNKSKYLGEDLQAQLYEHSLEVQLPFLQFFLPEVKIVPIVVSEASFQVYDEIGQAIAESIKEKKSHCLIVASSDMTHYEPQERAEEKDHLAIEAILSLDGKELLSRIKKLNISMCGYAAVIVMLSAALRLGAKAARLIKYQTSGESSGDYSSVVGYAGIVVK
ncbi:MAG: AmmeMemoRadiSam system protein B [Candidatus Omnitrophica bacterium]|nr:AmmeMemoRadiSam system protein B [Candidatus Omnitrophota bacterium]